MTEKRVHSVKASGATIAEAFENACNELQASDAYQGGEISARPVKGSVVEITAPVKEKVSVSVAEDKPTFEKMYMVDGNEAESLADAKAMAKELAAERQTDVDVTIEYRQTSDSNTVATINHQAASDGEFEFDIVERVEIEDDAEVEAEMADAVAE